MFALLLLLPLVLLFSFSHMLWRPRWGFRGFHRFGHHHYRHGRR